MNGSFDVSLMSLNPQRQQLNSFIEHLCSPLKQEFYESICAGKGSVGGEEDLRVIWVRALWVHQFCDKTLQSGCFKPADLQCAVLHEAKGGIALSGIRWRLDGFSVKSDSIDGPVFHLLSPLLHWVLDKQICWICSWLMEKYAHIESTVKLGMMPIAVLLNKDNAIIKNLFCRPDECSEM